MVNVLEDVNMNERSRPILEKLSDSVIRRFNNKPTVSVDGCTIWTAGNGRYGRFYIDGDQYFAHRIAVVLATGADIAPDMDVDHLCRNTKCVNPDHLEAVTHIENIMRGDAPAARTMRALALRNECQRGHDMSAPNAWISYSAGRGCRQCSTLRDAADRARARSMGTKARSHHARVDVR